MRLLVIRVEPKVSLLEHRHPKSRTRRGPEPPPLKPIVTVRTKGWVSIL
jgi:hypothetical protein